ncbi:MAG: hypothetical protein WC390_09095 [Sulfurimonas sp.]|jgi:hypothetical protein
MKIMKCDLCGKQVGEYKLSDLYTRYITHGINEICPDCRNIIDGFKRKVLRGIEEIEGQAVKEFIEKIHKEILKGE